jgi:cytochrome c-type biogenesis protein CcmE
MLPRQKAALAIGAVVSLGVAAWLTFSALPEGLSYYVTPAKVGAGETAQGGNLRVGGMIKPGTLDRAAPPEKPHLILRDEQAEVPVRISGPLPEMLREGQMAVAEGRIESGTLLAHRIIPLFEDPLQSSKPSSVGR